MATITISDQGAAKVDHLTIAERAAAGKAARTEVSRASHGEWAPAPDRPDPLELLAAQETTRVPELVPIRHARMAASPFAFYRGAAKVLAADLAAVAHTSLRVQLCGDAHLVNFGGFASPERSLVFDLNDFDETLPGPFEWDVKRLAASIEIAARSRGVRPQDPHQDRDRLGAPPTARRCAASPRWPNLDVWYAHLGVDDIMARGRALGTDALKSFQRTVDKAESKDRLKAEAKLTTIVDGEPRFISDPPLLVPIEELYPEIGAPDLRGVHPRVPAEVPPHPAGRPPPPAGELPLRPDRPQGGRGRQRRHPLLGHAHGRTRQQGSAVPPGQGSRGLGARALRRQERVRQPRPAGRRGPAAGPGGQRHLPGLGPRHRLRRQTP